MKVRNVINSTAAYSRRSIVADKIVGVLKSTDRRTFRQTAADLFRRAPHYLFSPETDLACLVEQGAPTPGQRMSDSSATFSGLIVFLLFSSFYVYHVYDR